MVRGPACAEPLAELEKDVFDAVDDRLLEVALEPCVALGQVEELDHEVSALPGASDEPVSSRPGT